MMRKKPIPMMSKSLLKKKMLLLQMTCQCLNVYRKAFQMLVLLNPTMPSFTITRVIVMMIHQLIPEKRRMIPTIVSCMNPNFKYIYIYSHYSNYFFSFVVVLFLFLICTNFFYYAFWQVRDRYGGRNLRGWFFVTR